MSNQDSPSMCSWHLLIDMPILSCGHDVCAQLSRCPTFRFIPDPFLALVEHIRIKLARYSKYHRERAHGFIILPTRLFHASAMRPDFVFVFLGGAFCFICELVCWLSMLKTLGASIELAFREPIAPSLLFVEGFNHVPCFPLLDTRV